MQSLSPSLSVRLILLYFALGIIALYFPEIIVSNRTYVAPAGRESEFPRTRVATWRSLLQKTQFLTVWSIYAIFSARLCTNVQSRANDYRLFARFYTSRFASTPHVKVLNLDTFSLFLDWVGECGRYSEIAPTGTAYFKTALTTSQRNGKYRAGIRGCWRECDGVRFLINIRVFPPSQGRLADEVANRSQESSP